MNTFWENISKFPRFLISVIAGFFLTTLYPFFELLRDEKKRFFTVVIILLIIISTYTLLRLILAIN